MKKIPFIKKAALFVAVSTAACYLSACSANSAQQASVSEDQTESVSSDISSVSDPVSETEVTPTEEAAEPTAEPVEEVTEEPTAEPTEEPVSEPTQDSVAESTEEQTEETPADTSLTADQLIIMNSSDMYTYDEFTADASLLTQIFPGLVTMDSLAQTTDGREILHFVVGNPDAEKQIFINGAIHAREYLTAQLVMKQMVTYLSHVANGDTYGDVSYQDMWNSVAIHVVPMINPDGVSISQFGLDGVQNQSTLDMLAQIAANDGSDLSTSYLDRWKANACGVDLNRNFDAYWEYYEGTGYPSADHYKGTAPGSEIESNAVIQLTLANNFLYTISYHTQGQLIYWCFDNMDSFYDISAAWVSQLSAATGYALDSNYSAIDPAGYSDWGIYRCQIPSVTIEVAYGESPYLQDQFDQVFQENINVWEITILSAMTR